MASCFPVLLRMLRKYLPYFALLFAATLLWWVKMNQRPPGTPKPEARGRIEAHIQADSDEISFDRTLPLFVSKHARCRMQCRQIDDFEVKQLIQNGVINKQKVATDERGTTIPVEGKTRDGQNARIVVAPKEDRLVLVTVIDLDTDWPCDCQ